MENNTSWRGNILFCRAGKEKEEEENQKLQIPKNCRNQIQIFWYLRTEPRKCCVFSPLFAIIICSHKNVTILKICLVTPLFLEEPYWHVTEICMR